MPRIFTCARCGYSYESAWTDEEALEEKETNFGEIPLENCVIVCDDCYAQITGAYDV